jgi:ribosomal-protein-alanine N-acetyltransferase
VAWIHLFAAGIPPGARSAWYRLWPHAAAALAGMGLSCVWAMTAESWLIDLLEGSGFGERGRVVAFAHRPSRIRTEGGPASAVAPLQESDLPAIERLDRAAFGPPWQMDPEALRETWSRSILATIVRREGRIAGYLMASPTPHGVHLTRLAVLPEEQSKGIGRALLSHLVNHFQSRGAPRITVNTQMENLRSQQLYRSLGFSESGESYPVFRLDLHRC